MIIPYPTNMVMIFSRFFQINQHSQWNSWRFPSPNCPNPWGQRPYANRSQRNHPYQGRGTRNPVVLEKLPPTYVFFLDCLPTKCLWCHFPCFLVGWLVWRASFLRFAWFHDWPWWKSRVGFNKTMDELSTCLSEHAVTWTWNSKQPPALSIGWWTKSLHRKWLFIHFHPFLKWLNLGFQGSCL